MGTKALLLGTLLPLASLAFPDHLEQRFPTVPNIMEFDCSVIPEVCANMCYGAFCLNVGTGLILDNASSTLKRERRTAAGCAPNPNRCSTKNGAPPGINCDEYPFASTDIQGGTKTRVNRCVPSGQNSIQGGNISKFKRKHCSGGCNFNVGFANQGSAADFCPGTCRTIIRLLVTEN
ncbi:hypothetical protein LTR37_015385 [Vermiconidia calcicola]|uniref:Uncharacterized protein n=1 Tax=Vermiconidia calcicola TaxID=1690605 RepID=A0ACC3MRL8_9PEZI|nr:hypothetical protein LTR37_015385 [Vermiconidia calcicola]